MLIVRVVGKAEQVIQALRNLEANFDEYTTLGELKAEVEKRG